MLENLFEAEESIKNEKDFKKYAKNKFETAFGENLDEDKMNKIIDGILKDYKSDAEKGDWGKLVGVLNKSFG
jgi:signal transduction histidine kinase